MTHARHDAVETLAFLASRDPEGFRALIESVTGRVPDGADPLAAAGSAASMLGDGIEDSPEARLRNLFGNHMRSLGRIERTTRKRCDMVMSALLGLGAEVLDGAAAGDERALSDWNSWVGAREGQFGQEASALLSSWRAFRADLKASESRWDFAFAEEGRGILGQAAAMVGGRRWDASSGHPEVVLVDLPFSPFVGVSEHDDPAVSEVVQRATPLLRRCKAALFKVEWDVAARLGLSADGYETCLAKAMPRHEVRSVLSDNSRCAPATGRDLYVAAAARWSGEFSIVALAQASADASAPAHPADPILPIAERVLRGFLRSVELN